ncbi:unnamed protein product [Prunus armeniaca]|uniref:Uncharacterized protein n=1 Tax=Prunus armeniaca TaxID=36596 RepID=A0A6J5XI39_PRUAR|nr:unnamed protein product [Prunus armeniaca]
MPWPPPLWYPLFPPVWSRIVLAALPPVLVSPPSGAPPMTQALSFPCALVLPLLALATVRAISDRPLPLSSVRSSDRVSFPFSFFSADSHGVSYAPGVLGASVLTMLTPCFPDRGLLPTRTSLPVFLTRCSFTRRLGALQPDSPTRLPYHPPHRPQPLPFALRFLDESRALPHVASFHGMLPRLRPFPAPLYVPCVGPRVPPVTASYTEFFVPVHTDTPPAIHAGNIRGRRYTTHDKNDEGARCVRFPPDTCKSPMGLHWLAIVTRRGSSLLTIMFPES